MNLSMGFAPVLRGLSARFSGRPRTDHLIDLAAPVATHDHGSPAPAKAKVAGANDLLTIPGGELPIDNETRRYCALYRSGRFLVVYGQELNANVRSVPDAAKRRIGITALEPEYVSYDTIRESYRAQIESSDTDHGAIRGRLIDRMHDAARHHIPDIHFFFDGTVCRTHYQKFTKLSKVIEEYDAVDAKALVHTCFYYSDVSDPAPVFGVPQSISFVKPEKLPPGVVGIRGNLSYPSGGGMELNLRLIYSADELKHSRLVDLKLPKADAAPLHYVLLQSSGLVTLGAPTEHGKSHTLNMMLFELFERSHGQAYIIAFDDPPEGLDRRIHQFDVKSDLVGANEDPYEKLIPMSVRKNPAAVKLGEVRKKAAANAAHELALTGKIVLTTLHTETATTIPARYVEIGVPVDIAHDHSRHILLGSQRLVPDVCQKCRIKLTDAAETDESLSALVDAFDRQFSQDLHQYYVRNHEGCDICSTEHKIDDGYLDRRLYLETLQPDAEVMRLLKRDAAEGREYWLTHLSGSSLRMKMHTAAAAGKISVGDLITVGSVAELVADLSAVRKGRPFAVTMPRARTRPGIPRLQALRRPKKIIRPYHRHTAIIKAAAE